MNNPTQTNNIKILPEHLIDQIQAGEVVERPASLIKELLENSVDAAARKITLHLVQNGMELITIKDDGRGITFEDLPYAFCRHATSKISEYNDLFQIRSYGFRGEALASAASISKIECTSQPLDSDGGQISFEGGIQKDHFKRSGLENGTQIVIKDLFFNTPARLKFIKSQTSEKNAIQNIINSYILCHPDIEFQIKWDDKEKQIWKPESIRERFSKIIGKKKSEVFDLFEINQTYEDVSVSGFLCGSFESKSLTKNQFIFVNDRPISEKSLHYILSNTYQKELPGNFLNAYFIKISISPDHLDVNVHPNKTTLKFMDPGQVYALVKGASTQSLKFATQESGIAPNIQNNLFDKSSEVSSNSNQSIKSYEGFKTKHTNFYSDLDSHEFGELREYDNPETNGGIRLIKRISPHYALIESSELKVISLKNLLTYFIETKLSTKTEPTPLLISIPFTIDWKTANFNFKLWQDKGFEFEALSPERVVLRTVPGELDHLQSLELGKFILKDILNLSDLELEQFYAGININSLSEILSQFSEVELSENKIQASLKNHLINQYF